MGLWAWLWDLGYLGRAPWDIGEPRPELVRLVKSGKLEPCRTIDLGCGIGENVIYLAQHGFEATGTDISSRAIAKARRKAQMAKVSPTFLVGDVTDLAEVEGPFDLVVDNGCFHSLFSSAAKEGYVRTLLRLTQPSSRYFLHCFVKDPRQRFRPHGLMEPDEVEHRFSGEFDIEILEPLPPGLDSFRPVALDHVYLMSRKAI